MLHVWFGSFRDDCITDVNGYFNIKKRKDWFNKPIVKQIIKDIDDTVAVKDEYMESPVFGAISPDRLSSGCKALILLVINPSCNVYASRMGDNCSDWLLKLADDNDVYVTLHHAMHFNRDFNAKIMDTGAITHTRKEFLDAYLDYKYTVGW